MPLIQYLYKKCSCSGETVTMKIGLHLLLYFSFQLIIKNDLFLKDRVRLAVSTVHIVDTVG